MSPRFNPVDLDLEPKVKAITAMIQGYQDIQHYEIYCSAQSRLGIELEKGSIKKAESGKDVGIGVRLANGLGQSAFSYTSDLDAGSLQRMVKGIVAMVGKSTRDQDFHSFAEKTPIPWIPRDMLIDKRIENLDIEDATRLVFATLESAQDVGDPRIYSINIDFEARNEQVMVINSNGIEVHEQSTAVELYCAVTSKDGVSMTSESELRSGRALELISSTIGERAARRSLSTLGKVRIKTGLYPVVLSPRAVAAIIGGTIEKAADGELLQQKKSFLYNELGKSIAPSFLSIMDDALSTEYSRIHSRSFDAEGTGSNLTTIIDKGVFMGGLNDAYTAQKGRVMNTANAWRANYGSLPSIAASNMMIRADRSHVATRDELISSIKRGIFFDDTGDMPDIASGEYSGMISTGFLIEDGRITKPVLLAAFGINFRDLLNAIELVGDDVQDIGGTICPSLLLSGMRISSQLD